MLKLNKMNESEYQEYIAYGLENYASEKVKAGQWTPEESLERTKKEFHGMLPDGINTENNYLFSVYDDKIKANVGILWVDIKENLLGKISFIYDIRIKDELQGKGYGKATLVTLENWLKTQNVKFLKLHVFGHNTVARSLYLKYGFEEKNVFMSKTIQ